MGGEGSLHFEQGASSDCCHPTGHGLRLLSPDAPGPGREYMVAAFREGKIADPMNDIRYYNVKTMRAIKLK